MKDKEEAELQFWIDWFNSYDEAGYRESRMNCYNRVLSYLPELKDEPGLGLDLGCGLVSMFENTGLNMVAIDPLLEEYQKVYLPPESSVRYVTGHRDDGIIQFPDDSFDFIACINVIDHTEHWRSLLREIRRVLKPGGRLYFMVNFDPFLTPPHHVMIWNYDTVRNEMPFFMLKGVIDWVECYSKYQFWGRFSNEA